MIRPDSTPFIDLVVLTTLGAAVLGLGFAAWFYGLLPLWEWWRSRRR